MTGEIRRVAVWSGWVRLAHWSLAGATLLLLATGWLIARAQETAPTLAGGAAELHHLAAGLLVFGLALRLYLGLFGTAAERFEYLLPTASEWPAMRASLWFYLSLGNAPRPNWYAHNPLWKPVYPLLLLLLAVSALTGWLMPERPVLGGLYLPGLHTWLADTVAVVTGAHLLCVIVQDVRGLNADISAMFSGQRHFPVDRSEPAPPTVGEVRIRPDDIRRP